MFEKIRCNNFGGSCIGKTSGYKCAICSTKVKCEQEIIKRFEWLIKQLRIRRNNNLRTYKSDCELIDQSQTLPIEKIERELK